MRTFRGMAVTKRLARYLEVRREGKSYPTDRIPDIRPSVAMITEDDMVILDSDAYEGLHEMVVDLATCSIGDICVIHRDKSKSCLSCCMFMNRCNKIECRFIPFILIKKKNYDHNYFKSHTRYNRDRRDMLQDNNNVQSQEAREVSNPVC